MPAKRLRAAAADALELLKQPTHSDDHHTTTELVDQLRSWCQQHTHPQVAYQFASAADPGQVTEAELSLSEDEFVEVLAASLEALRNVAAHSSGGAAPRGADVAHAHGLELVYHHHLGTVIQTKEETIRLMELTDPAKVSLLFDTGHAYVGDGDVMGLLEATIDRVKHVHFKDVRPEKMEESKAAERSFLDSFLAGMFTVPGDGTIDFTVPYKFLVDHGYSEWILVEAEQDPAIANPLEYARKARAYLEGTLFKA